MDTKKIKEQAKNAGFDVVNVVNVWSNGNKIRRFQGQNEKNVWHKPTDGYKKMVAILVEIDDV